MLSIWARRADLPDPRSGNARKHKLLDVLTIALTASICGAESCVDFADFARDRETLFREFLELPGGPPSHDTFSFVSAVGSGGVCHVLCQLSRWPRPGRHRGR